MSDQHLKSIIPEMKTRRLIVDMHEGSTALYEGLYLVSAGKERKPNSVYQIMSFRKVNSRVHARRYELMVIKTPDMVPHAKISFRFEAMVMDQPAVAIRWHSRKAKKSCNNT